MAAPRRKRKDASGDPWYAPGVRFECVPDCGRCCTRHDEFSYVYLEPDDVRALASFLELPVAEFRARWTFREEGHTALRIEGDACPFLDGSRCSVYPARPRQCRVFPFWKESLRSRDAWEALGTFCPGIGQGDLISVESIRSRARGDA